MPTPVISVEHLSKRYLVGHRQEGRGQHGYTALRDVIGRELRSAARKAVDMTRGRQVVQGDAVEEFWALKDVSFEVERGEVLGIIGRNGAGKSTLLKLLSRITEPTEGRITLRGRVASLLEVGTGFHPELTGRENIYLNGAVLGMTRAEIRKKFDEIVAFAEVERFLDTPVKRYSSGMYVRLAFAVAAHLEPEILVVDEVLSVGDAEFQKKCLGKMNDVSRREGRTVLFVSHNMAAVRTLCERAILLRAGVPIFDGPVGGALEAHLASHGARAQNWVRSSAPSPTGAQFEAISATVDEAATLRLSCAITIRVGSNAGRSMLALDITDAQGGAIMQALPSALPFIPEAPGRYDVTLEVKLPPLVPGTYWLTFWMGPGHFRAYDLLEGILAFDVLRSPTPGRTVPHTPEHGYVVPPSRCELVRADRDVTGQVPADA